MSLPVSIRPVRLAALAAALFSLTACGGGDGPSELGAWSAPYSLADQTYALGVSSNGVIASMLWLGDSIRFRQASTGDWIRSVGIAQTPIHGVFNSNGSTFYVVCQSSNEVGKVKVSDGTYTKSDLGHPTYNIAISETGDAIYVTTADGWVFALDAATLAKQDSVSVYAASNGIAARGGELWVSTFAGKLYRLNPATLARIDSVTRHSSIQRVVLNAGATILYAVEEDSSRIIAVNTGTKSIISAPLSGKGIGAALDEHDDQLWVTSRTTGVVQMFDLATLGLVDSLVIGGTPRDVTISADGRTAVIGAEAFSIRLRR